MLSCYRLSISLNFVVIAVQGFDRVSRAVIRAPLSEHKCIHVGMQRSIDYFSPIKSRTRNVLSLKSLNVAGMITKKSFYEHAN
jgi:hypothetical protein